VTLINVSFIPFFFKIKINRSDAMLDFYFSNKEKNIPFLFLQFQVLTDTTNYFHLIIF
jgi:hypothetical protein